LRNNYSQAFIFLAVIFSVNSFAGDKIAQSLVVEPDGKLFVDITRGLVKIKGWDKNEISIQGELDDSVKELIFKNKKHKTLIKAVSKGEEHWGDSSILKIYMPHQTRLYFKGVDATYMISLLEAGVDGKTMTGDLVANNLADNVSLSTMSGQIKLMNSTGKANLETVAGDIILEGSYDKAKIRSMSGDLTLNIADIDEVKAKTISGDLMARGDVKNEAEISLESVNGSIVYYASDKLNAECSLSSKFGGEIFNAFSKDQVKNSYMNQKSLNFVSGDGSGSLSMHTISGDITIEKGNQD